MKNDGRSSDEYVERMAQVSASYRRNLATVLDDSVALRDRAVDQGELKNVAVPLGEIAHRVAGSAGLFGFTDVGEAADQVETALHSARQVDFNTSHSAAVSAALDQLIAALRKALH